MQKSDEQKFQELILFITGPTYVEKEILEAGMLPVFGHRDKEAKLRIEPVIKNLKTIANVDEEYEVLLIPGTGSSAMEASIRSLVRDDEKVLAVSVGAFGDLYYNIAKVNGKNVKLLRFEDGKCVQLSMLEEELKNCKPNVVMFTHNETSTGVINNVEGIGQLISSYGALPLVDGVSIFGGAPSFIKEGGIAMYSTSTQKCLGLPPGMGIAFVHQEALEKAKSVENKGYLTDIVQHAASSTKFQTLNTTPTQLANQLYVQTEHIVKEGVKKRFLRHEIMKQITYDWIKFLSEGFELFPEEYCASPSVTCIKVPETLNREALREEMRKKNYLFDAGYREMKIPTIRIGHMGDITNDMLCNYLNEVSNSIKEMMK